MEQTETWSEDKGYEEDQVSKTIEGTVRRPSH